MADTIRNRAALEALLADNIAGNISPQDVRDFLATAGLRGGIADYNDATTVVTPIVVTGGAGAVYLTNDGAGPNTYKNFKDADLTDVWDTSANEFDWTQLALGDAIDIRLDLDVVTTAVNQEVVVSLEMASGVGGSYDIPFIDSIFKSPATYKLTRYSGIYMGNSFTLDNPAKFKISSDANATVVVNGWYVKIQKV